MAVIICFCSAKVFTDIIWPVTFWISACDLSASSLSRVKASCTKRFCAGSTYLLSWNGANEASKPAILLIFGKTKQWITN